MVGIDWGRDSPRLSNWLMLVTAATQASWGVFIAGGFLAYRRANDSPAVTPGTCFLGYALVRVTGCVANYPAASTAKLLKPKPLNFLYCPNSTAVGTTCQTAYDAFSLYP
jgi:hypothetical protein